MEGEESFEQWVADEGGPEAVVTMVEEVRRQADEGVLTGFTDKDEFLAHVARPGRRSARPGESSYAPTPTSRAWTMRIN